MGSVLDANSQPVAPHVETATQSCNSSVGETLSSSREISSKLKPVLVPSLQIRTGSDNLLLSSISPTWGSCLSETPVIHSPSPSLETNSSYASPKTDGGEKNYIGAQRTGPDVNKEAIPTELTEVHALNRYKTRASSQVPTPCNRHHLISQTICTGNGNASPKVAETEAAQVANSSHTNLQSRRNNVQCDLTTDVKPLQHSFKLPKFDGTSAAESFIAQFRNCASL